MAAANDLWAALEARVSAKCIDGDATGACRIAAGRTCALKEFFPQIVNVVDSVQGPSLAPYVDQLRNRVCGYCVNQSPEGACSVRDDVECALDRYFALIVQVIEEHRRKPEPDT